MVKKTIIKASENSEEDKEDKMRIKQPESEEHTKDCDCEECLNKKMEHEDEDKTEKGEEGGENPEESAESGNDANSSTSPNAGVPSSQNVEHGASGIDTGRQSNVGTMANGQSPSEVTYSGKSVNPDLMKSPLFVELNKSINALSKALSSKLEAVEKSFNDRISNMQKTLNSVEQFYKKVPLYKANSEVERIVPREMSLQEKMQAGLIQKSF